MKKVFLVLCCVLMSGPAWCARECTKEGITVPERGWLLVNEGEKKWRAYQCINNNNNKSKTPDENDYELVGKEFVQFCDNPNEGMSGWIDVDTNGNQTLRVRESDIKEKYLNGSNNISLSRYNNKNTACFYCGGGYTYSNGKCVENMTQSCAPVTTEKCNKGNTLVGDGIKGCYICKKGDKANCTDGDRVFAKKARLGNSSNFFDNQIWSCNSGSGTWTHREPDLCNGSVDLSADVRAKHATLTVVNPDGLSTHNNASSWVVDNGDICYKYACNDDWIQSGGKCVQGADYETICKNSGGTYADDKLSCTCDDVKGLKPSEDNKRCVCIDGDDYAWNEGAMNSTLGILGACVKTQQALQREEEQQQQKQKEQAQKEQKQQKEKQQKQQQQQDAKKACVDSGGDGLDNAGNCMCANAKHLIRNGTNTCDCESSDYTRDTNNQCVVTDVAKKKQACGTVIKNAKWNDILSDCICDNEMQTVNKDWTACEYPEGYEACAEKFAVADWKNGECVCKQSGYYEWKNNDCQKTAATISAEIDKVYADIDNLTAGYKKSKWKDAEGKFNTARLASDSIAGVVLGTVGGVVTSTIIKKNQVEDGFEDLKCSIGGQSVATWGDEFQVGLQ